jgi:protein-S-isoprenylcysteine O-methyltransferase Ste14
MTPERAVFVLWIALAASWVIAAAWTRRTEDRPGIATEVLYRIPMVAGVGLMVLSPRLNPHSLQLRSLAPIGKWVCVALVASGIAFALWARQHLGQLWSAHITRKADHRVIDSGPYAIVRHPIYTGLLLSLLATAIMRGRLLDIGGFLLVFLGLLLKARMEERWLTQQLDPRAYGEYRRRVPMLIPFGPKDR